MLQHGILHRILLIAAAPWCCRSLTTLPACLHACTMPLQIIDRTPKPGMPTIPGLDTILVVFRPEVRRAAVDPMIHGALHRAHVPSMACLPGSLAGLAVPRFCHLAGRGCGAAA